MSSKKSTPSRANNDSSSDDGHDTILVGTVKTSLGHPLLSLYQSGNAVVQSRITVNFQHAGLNRVEVTGLPPAVDQQSIRVRLLSTPTKKAKFKTGFVSVLKPTNNLAGIIDWCINRGEKTTVRINAPGGLSAGGELITKIGETHAALGTTKGFDVIPFEGGELEVDTMFPKHLTNSATLVLTPTVSEAGTYELLVKFETPGINWSASYDALNDAGGNNFASLCCLAQIVNNSKCTFEGAQLKIFSGANRSGGNDVQHFGGRQMGIMPAAHYGGGMPSKAVGGRHNYPLSTPRSTLAPGLKGIELGQFDGVPYTRELYFSADLGYEEGNPEDITRHPASIRLRLTNQLGSDLPPGAVEVNDLDEEGDEQKTNSGEIEQHIKQGQSFRLELNEPDTAVQIARRQGVCTITPAPSKLAEIAKTLPKEGVNPRPHHPASPSDDAGSNQPGEDHTPDMIHTLPRVDVIENYGRESREVIVEVQLTREQEVIDASHKFTRTGNTSGYFTVTAPGSVPRTKTEGPDVTSPLTIEYKVQWKVKSK